MKKGVSLIALVITIIVLSILTGIAVTKISPLLNESSKSQLEMEIAQLESLMNTYKVRKSGVINFEMVCFSIADLRDTQLQQFSGETITNNQISLYVIDLDEIDAAQVNFGNLRSGPKDRYLYSGVTGKVYYEQGLEVDGEIYYYVENGEE